MTQSKLVYMADGLSLYKIDDSYIVMNPMGFILKEAKTAETCQRYILKTLQSRRAAEREAIEETNQNQNKNRAL